ncbi:uncharacterized protein CCR75_009511 [Bremia lactucae]|uniref:Uncharacterized protein n=1 Tax=Bremia lactucae TaxID=4779 RepID=A0A976FFM5_BRELC|nr:hypothetical protein CCR75_009511 [Bremia lactucae]
MKVEASYAQNPVFISRVRTPLKSLPDSRPSDSARAIYNQMLGAIESQERGQVTIRHELQIYSEYDIMLAGRLDNVINLFKHVGFRDVEQVAQQIFALLQDRNEGRNNMSGYQQGIKSQTSDLQLSIFRTLKVMSTTTDELKDRIIKTCDDLRQENKSVGSADLEAKLRCMDDLIISFSAVIAFFALINPSLTATASYVDSTGPTVTPIVKKRTVLHETTDFSDLFHTGESEEKKQSPGKAKVKKPPSVARTQWRRKNDDFNKSGGSNRAGSPSPDGNDDDDVVSITSLGSADYVDDVKESHHELEQDEYDLLPSEFNVGLSLESVKPSDVSSGARLATSVNTSDVRRTRRRAPVIASSRDNNDAGASSASDVSVTSSSVSPDRHLSLPTALALVFLLSVAVVIVSISGFLKASDNDDVRHNC